MPVSVREKLKAVTRDLGSQSRVADVLGVSRSRVSRWLRSENPDPENQRKVEGLEFVLTRLLQLWTPDTAVAWLVSRNAHLLDARPISYIADGRITEVLGAIDSAYAMGYA